MRYMTSRLAARRHTLSQIVRYYGPRPSRLPDVIRWVQSRGDIAIDSRVPWWPFVAADAVAERLPDGARVFEYGGGGSTLWLQDCGANVTAVEHDVDWHRVLQERAPAADVILQVPSQEGSVPTAVHPGQYFDEYVTTISGFPDASFDIVIVDGRARVACGLAAMPKVRPGGMLLLDDSDRSKYAGLRGALVGWFRTDYRGLKPGGGPPCQTSVWIRPASDLI